MNYPYGVSMPPGTVPAPAYGAPTQVPLAAPPVYQQAPQIPTQPQAAPPGKFSLSGDEILDGDGVPAELRGRKASEVFRIYGTLADDFIARKRAGRPQQQPPQQQAQPQPQQEQPSLFQDDNPDERIAQIVRQVVGEAVQPFQQQSLEQGRRTAYDQARQQIPDFQSLEADILDVVKGSSDEALANPEFWQHAADLARGRRARQQPQPQQQAQALPFQENPFSQAPMQYPQPQMPPTQQQIPAPYVTQPSPAVRPATSQFFTEAPTAPSPYANTHNAALTPAQMQVARLAGVSPEQYAAMAALQQREGARR